MAHHARMRRSLCVCLGILAGYQVGVAWGTQPNIVFILSDDMGYSNTGFSAALNNRTTQFETPNLDALAQQGVVGSQFYVSHSLCGPSRYGLLTGLYSQRQGYENNVANWGADAIKGDLVQGVTPDVTMLPQRLKSLGYSTGMIGKWHEGFQQGLNTPIDKGFDEFFGFHSGDRSYYGYGSGYIDPDHGINKNGQYYENQWQTEGDHSTYDPVKGRYLSDAFGDEAASYVNRHAADSNPFFLYMAVNAPHTPNEVKQSDYDHFANITNSFLRNQAAMEYAMDRSIGKVMSALQANGIADNTIVIFANDNGATPDVPGPNAPFNGNKGTMYEGGIRVPFIIKGPGLTPGVYNSPITALDMVPTLVTAAGGDITQFQHDGYDVMPYLKGQATDDPNKPRFWRNFNCYAVRKGDFKLTIMYQGFGNRALFNIANNPQETVFLSNAAVVADLSKELTQWEATLEKPKWGDIGAWNQNLFDHFVFRNDQSTSNWSGANMWTQSGTTNIATFNPADAYANAVIEFAVRNDADYTANNDMKRLSRETFMLNQLQLTGNFTGGTNRQGTITGNALLMVKDLAGNFPQIRLDATSNGTGAAFKFATSNEIQLLNDLQITGNGTQQFVLGGSLRDYYESLDATNPNITHPHNVTKTGTSQLVLAGSSTFGGTFAINEGQVRVNGATAAINGPTKITVANGAMLALDNGSITVPTIDNAAGGVVHLYGGTLKAPNITGDLINDGGALAPGTIPAIRTIGGSLQENAGSLQMLINSATSFDRLQIGSSASLGGALSITLANGYSPLLNQSFQILTASSGMTGTFANLLLPALSGGKTWQVLYGSNDVRLTVSALIGISGDYNQNGTVDARDYVIWRKTLGSTTNLAADGNHNGIIDNGDYSIWRQNFGTTSSGVGSGAGAAVPEPCTVALFLIAGLSGLLIRHRRRV
jgi:autotransporter-associated beta strand protein